MLREFDLQRMHWADKTQSMLHQRQMEACEARLLSYPTESIFTLQDERETECWWQCSYDAEESPKSPVLHTLREMRANVLARLPVEAALLTETEHALIVRLILCGGQARIDGWQELSAAESLLRRLWCTLEVDEQDVLLHLPRELMTPLSLTLREQRHQELRSRLLFFDTDTKAALYLSGMLSAKQALSRLYESVLHDSYANDEALALRCLKAGNDFYYNRAGELFLLHPGLADPEKILREGGDAERDDAALRAENGPLGAAQGDDVRAAAQAVAPEAAERLRLAGFGPGLTDDGLHQTGAAAEIDARVDGPPEFPALCHGGEADADLLGMLRGQRLKERECAERRQPPRHAAVLRRDQKFPLQNTLFHSESS